MERGKEREIERRKLWNMLTISKYRFQMKSMWVYIILSFNFSLFKNFCKKLGENMEHKQMAKGVNKNHS